MARVKKNSTKDYIMTVGRRKSAVARVRLYPSTRKIMVKDIEAVKGDVIVNDMPIKDYFRFEAFPPKLNKFLKAMSAESKFIFTVKVSGGGLASQLDAMVHGMGRALDKQDTDTYHPLLKAGGYLTRDARVRERRKVGTGGKARRKKQSPKR